MNSLSPWRTRLVLLLALALGFALDAHQRLRLQVQPSDTAAEQLPPEPQPAQASVAGHTPDFQRFLPEPEEEEAPEADDSADEPQEPDGAVTQLSLDAGAARLRLGAISHTGKGSRALLLEETQAGELLERHRVSPGDELHGYGLVGIERNRITLQGPNRQFDLLMYNSGGKPGVELSE